VCSSPSAALNNNSLTCPYHAWTYDVTGSLIGAPNMSDQADFDRRDFPLVPVGIALWGGFVMLHLQGPSLSFAQDFQPLLERLANWSLNGLALVETLHYEVRCNWKMLFQNYSECYHCPTVHPALSRLTPYRSATNDLTSGPFLGGPMELDKGVETVSTDGQLVCDQFPGLSEQQRSRVYYYTIFPTMFISAHPDYVMVHVLDRRDRATTHVACHFLVRQASAASVNGSLSRATRMWDEVNRQDWQMCERTQQGVESPAFRPGPYSSLESMVSAFDRHYLEIMER
jgi:Rieske 2Fe-2S family protein